MKAHRRWFVAYFWRAILFYAEFKNLLARVAQLKEAAGEKAWKVTPRGRSVDLEQNMIEPLVRVEIRHYVKRPQSAFSADPPQTARLRA